MTLILMRHGQSIWNEKNLFTGWVDVPLTEKGIQEAIAGGKKIRHVPIDIAFTSTLIRAQNTLTLSLLGHAKTPIFQHEDKRFQVHGSQEIIPVYKAWQLNERCYGELQGLNKAETAKKFGESQVHIWRRSYDVAPPGGESLKMTAERTLPYFKEQILPLLENEKNVFICAHGNSLRSIVMYLENLTKEAVVELEMATGVPVLYEYNRGAWKKST